jgi:adenylylsulfate kinase
VKILICGLPGSGKTTLASRLTDELSHNFAVEWVNADEVRHATNDWDFSLEGRLRQTKRMRYIAELAEQKEIVAVCDFICPTQELRKIFNADLVIWMDTIQTSQHEDTNQLFEPLTVEEYDFRITTFDDIDQWSQTLADLVWVIE